MNDVELDEAYMHPNPQRRSAAKTHNSQIVFGMVERGGKAKIKHVKSFGVRVLVPETQRSINKTATIYTDEHGSYRLLKRRGYEHKTINHSQQQYVVGRVHTQNVENFWSIFKRGIYGVYRHCDPNYLQRYANEYSFRYSNRQHRVLIPHHLCLKLACARYSFRFWYNPCMKIVFLNTWSGRVQNEISAYLEQQVPDTDIFCFQEAYDAMKSLCMSILKDYKEILAYKFVNEDDDFPQAIYVKRGITVVSFGTILKEQKNCGLGLYVEVNDGAKTIYICNFHGMSRPVDKLDDPNRVLQSKLLIKFFSDKKPAIIGGDFNIFPETKSIQMFEEHGYKDLIKDFKIVTTRNQLAWDMYPNSKQYYSDYVFMSPDLSLKEFVVPDNKISDHLPLEVAIDD